MNYDDIFSQLKNEWLNSTSMDEWFFPNFREEFISKIDEKDIIFAINYITKIILFEEDSSYVNELLDLISDLVRKANTTEISEEIKKNLSKLDIRFSNSLYQKSVWEDIKKFYFLN